MLKKIFIEVKKSCSIFCVLFSVLTLVSSIIQLVQNIPSDSNLHILLRASITMMVVIIMQVFKHIRFKSMILSVVAQYTVSMGLVFIFVTVVGIFEPLHETAYRDIFFNFTAVFICVALVEIIIVKIKKKNKEIVKNRNI